MGVRTVREGVYFDGAPLWRMTARVETARDNGFLTTPERAERVREMTEAVERHAKRGERVMMFGSMPIMNYLTETRPALGCSWPELLSEGMLERKLREAEDVKMVMIQKFGTIGGAYEDRFEENAFHTERKDRILMEYLYRKGFRKIEEGKEYEIWVGTDEGARDGTLHRRINKNCAESRRIFNIYDSTAQN